MFTNRLVVESPGRLPGTVRIDNIRHTHFSRNPLIAKYLQAYEFVKEFGEGVNRMCKELEAADCGDVIFFPYAFMLRTTVMNRIGYAQSYDASQKVISSSANDKQKSLDEKHTHPTNELIKTAFIEPSLSSIASFKQKDLRLNVISQRLNNDKKRKNPTIKALQKVATSFADNEVFGSKQISLLIPCSEETARRIISNLKGMNLIVSLKGQGKGRYTFKPLSESE